MSDKELGEALLKLDLTPTVSTAAQIERIIEGDRTKIKWLTWLAVGLWILSAIGVLSIFVGGGFVFPMIAKVLQERGEGSLEQPDTPFLMLAKLIAMVMVFGSMTIVILIAAGLTTVLLVFRTRRATLRQINANLLQISEQLKQLRPAERSTGADGPPIAK